jgi:arylsulfatase A-like enzyme
VLAAGAGPVVLALLALGAAPPQSGPPAPLSVLLVTVDTLRADHVGVYGRSPSPTPNLDRLAASGVRFAEARALVPLTLPSHATLLTGMLPPRHGLRAIARC